VAHRLLSDLEAGGGRSRHGGGCAWSPDGGQATRVKRERVPSTTSRAPLPQPLERRGPPAPTCTVVDDNLVVTVVGGTPNHRLDDLVVGWREDEAEALS
jgi:hypothetical protein